jgi:Arc/MetJ family transcription regulator
MVPHMKTTIEIADALLEHARRVARRERKTLRQIVHEALRQRLAGRSTPQTFRLRKHPFKGQGRQAGIAEGRWETVRDLIYRLS